MMVQQPMMVQQQPMMVQQQQPMVIMQQQPMIIQQQQPMVIQQQPVIIQQQNPGFQQQGLNNNQQQPQNGKNPIGINGPQTGFQRLESRGGLTVRQRFNWEEVVSGCEMPNTYTVYGMNSQGDKKGNPLFKCKEVSGCCSRMCLSAECRPFQVNINTADILYEALDNEPFLRVDRPCQCTFYCCNRPEIKIFCVEGGKDEFLGKVVDPFNFCNLQLDVYDNCDQKKYTIEGYCCQLGIWCKWPCDPCQRIEFKIKGQSGEELADLVKTSAGCVQTALADTSNFVVNFPANCKPQDKALLMCAAVFLDYRHFEEGQQKKKNNGVMVVGGGDM
jgi:hypothetical protein